MPVSVLSRHAVRKGLLAAAGLTAALWSAAPAFSASGGPFRPFLGTWRGAGEILSTNGQQEPIRCRATYSGDDFTVAQSIVCASDSFRVNIDSRMHSDGDNLSGQWQETTRGVQGELTGQVGRGDIEGTVTGPGFTAQYRIRARGKRQAVHFEPSAGDIRSVDITFSRGG